MSTTVKHFHSAMSGAPTLNGVAGSLIAVLIAVLDACLVGGFGLKSADSVVVAGGGWGQGNVLRINTIGAEYPFWEVLPVQQGPETVPRHTFIALVRGVIDAD